jgi:hypothetical protein
MLIFERQEITSPLKKLPEYVVRRSLYQNVQYAPIQATANTSSPYLRCLAGPVVHSHAMWIQRRLQEQ